MALKLLLYVIKLEILFLMLPFIPRTFSLMIVLKWSHHFAFDTSDSENALKNSSSLKRNFVDPILKVLGFY